MNMTAVKNKKSSLPRKSLTLHLYSRLLPIQMLSYLSISLCSVINSLIVSRTLGAAALSQLKVVDAFTNIIIVFNLLLSGGVILLVSRAFCKGEKDTADGFFTTAITVSTMFGIVITFLCLAFSAPICTYFGADADTVSACCTILKGNTVYYFALPLCSVFLSLFQIRSDFKTPIVTSVIFLIINISLNFLFLSVLKLEIRFTAYANSISQLILLLLLVIKHCKTKFASFSIKSISFPAAGSLLGMGITDAASRIWSVIKASFMIKILADVGGAAALTNLSVISNVDALSYGLFSSSFQLVTIMIAGIYINEEDRESLKRFTKTVFLLAISVSTALAVFMFLSAYPAAVIYGVEDIQSHLTAQRIFSAAFPFYMTYQSLIILYAALNKKKVVNIISFFTALLLPLITLLVFGKMFGIIGFWWGVVAGDALSFVVTFTYSIIHNKHFPRSVDDLLCLDKDFGVSPENTFFMSVSDIEEATNASARIIEFCKKAGVDGKTSYLSGLCLEEIAVNIVTHGFRHLKKQGVCELVVVNLPEAVRLIVRDNCRRFNLNEKLSSYDESDITKGIGIKIVTGLSEVTYKNMYGLNILTMTLSKSRENKA